MSKNVKKWDENKRGTFIFIILCVIFWVIIPTLIGIFASISENKRRLPHYAKLDYLDAQAFMTEHAHGSFGGNFLVISGSFTKTNYPAERYIFLAQNGPADSYKINDITVRDGYENSRDVYFYYIEDNEEPYLKYQYDGFKINYYIYTQKDKVLQIAGEMLI